MHGAGAEKEADKRRAAAWLGVDVEPVKGICPACLTVDLLATTGATTRALFGARVPKSIFEGYAACRCPCRYFVSSSERVDVWPVSSGRV